MTNTMPRAGIDVHARQSHLAVIDLHTGELTHARIAGPPEQTLDRLTALGPNLIAVYEAGPTGLGLARKARELGIDLRVAAPGLIPRAPSDRVKTDRRDAERLARLLAAGELRFAHVPTLEQEHFRDLVRAIEDARGDLMRARHRLSKFLLRHGERFSGGNWTRDHLRWLERLRFDDPASRATFSDYLAAVQLIARRREALVATLEEIVPNSSHARTIARLRCFRGIDTLSAAGLCAEVSNFHRFARPKLLSGFLGIVPRERTSDEKRRQGAITKAGTSHGRRLLVEAAHHYRHRPAIGERQRQRQNEQDPRICEVAWRAQRRLHSRWSALAGPRGKPAGVTAIACARELAAFVWEAATLD